VGASAHAVYSHLGLAPDLVTRAFSEAGEDIWLEGKPDPRAIPASVPPQTTDPAPPREPTAAPAPPTPKGKAGGCSISTEPQSGSVEYAAGLVAFVASLIGLRRRLGKKDDGTSEEPLDRAAHRERLPSFP
jgi:hypothetical protein